MMLETDFLCKGCGNTETTSRLSISDAVTYPPWCSACFGTAFRRIFHPARAIFRGGGWASKS
jgi:predicted nucleic acid-binding Zn ribbon protein